MEKEPANILVVNRPWKEGEHIVKDIFTVYGKKYDLIIFPLTESKNRTEVVIFSRKLMFHGMMDLFEAKCEWPEGEPFGDFDLESIDEQTFYDILDQKFKVTTTNLSH